MSEREDSQRDPNQQKGEVQYLFVGHKAGLESVDTSKITKIINESTQTSEFYKRQQLKRQQYDERIAEMNLIIEQAKQDPIKLMKFKQESDEKLEQLKQQLTLDRVWAHFDMDMFYVACEIKDRPELKDLPVAVGGLSMISTANYVARKYGVRSAMPGFIGKKLCPQLILIPCNFDKYRKASELFKNVLNKYDPNLESMGLDEANLDLTDYIQSNNINSDAKIYDLCHQIRQQVFEATGGLSCSCGIGPNKMIAKICSDMNKPNGQFQIVNDQDKVRDFMKDLPIRKIPGIGNVSEQLLKGIGVDKCSQILDRIIDIKICFRDLSFDHLICSALGIGRTFHTEEQEKKSLSVSRTFPQISTIEEIHQKIKYLSQKLSEDAMDEQKFGKHISISIKNIKFDTKSKNRMIGKYIQDAESIEYVAKELLKELLPTDPLRSIGIRLSHLVNESEIKINNGINKYFNKGDKGLNDSISLSSRSSSKSKNINQHSIKTLFKNQNDKLLQESLNNSKMTDFVADNLLSQPKLIDISQTNISFDIRTTNQLTSKVQPQFLNLIDNYENSRSENDSDEDEQSFQKSKLSKNTFQKQQRQLSQRSIDQLKLLNQIESDSDIEQEENQNNYQSKVNNKNQEVDDDEDDSEDDIAYLKRILNKSVSDRLSQISDKKSQEEQRQSISTCVSNTMTPQFVQQHNINNQQKQIFENEKQMIDETPKYKKPFQSQQQLKQQQKYQEQQQSQYNQQNQQQRQYQGEDKQMLPENDIKQNSFLSQQSSKLQFQQPYQQQQQYFQRKNDEQHVNNTKFNDKYEYTNTINSMEYSQQANLQQRGAIKQQQTNDKEINNSQYNYDVCAVEMSQQLDQSTNFSQINKKRQSEQTCDQIEQQLKLKKKFIPRLFECPICYSQIDSYGNATFVNNHITNCMNSLEEKVQKAEMEQQQSQASQRNKQGLEYKQNPVSIFNNIQSNQSTKSKQNIQKVQRKNSHTKHTLDQYIIKQNN